MVKSVTRRSVLVVSVFFCLVSGPLISESYENIALMPAIVAFTRVERLKVEYVAANQTTHEIFCKLCNTGSMGLVLMEVSVNGNIVKTRDLLPIPIPPSYRYTYAFMYDGPWEGSILVTFSTYTYLPSRKDYQRLVDLQNASQNPIEQAFIGSSSRGELINLDPSWLNSLINSSLQSATFESSEAQTLICEAKTKLAEAQDAYARGESEAAYLLATSALILTGQAMVAEKSYPAEKTSMIIAGVAGGATVATVISLHLLRKRRGKKHPVYLHVTSSPQLDKTLGRVGGLLLAGSAFILLIVIGVAVIVPFPPFFYTQTLLLMFFDSLGFLLTFFGFISITTALGGGMFILLAFRGLAQLYRDEAIFRNTLYAFTCSMVSLAIFLLWFQGDRILSPLWYMVPPPEIVVSTVTVTFTFLVLAAIFCTKAFTVVSIKSGEKRFKTVGSHFKVAGFLLSVEALLWLVAYLVAYLISTLELRTVPYALFYQMILLADGILLIAGGILFNAWILTAKAFVSVNVPPSSASATELSGAKGGAIVAFSFIISILVSAVGLMAPERPQITHTVLLILVPYATAPVTMVGTAFLLLAIKVLAERYKERRILKEAIHGFICMVVCIIAATTSASTAYSFAFESVRPLAPVTPPLAMLYAPRWSMSPKEVEVHAFVSAMTFGSLLLASVFFWRSLVLLSKVSNKKRLKTAGALLPIGSMLTVVFSGTTLVLIPWQYDISIDSLVVAIPFGTTWVLGQVLAVGASIGVGILAVAWMLISMAFSSIATQESTRPPTLSGSQIG